MNQTQRPRCLCRIEELTPDPDPAAGAFLDTAAIVPHLDLVVAIDSSVAHLAGAHGSRVWVALSAASDMSRSELWSHLLPNSGCMNLAA